MAKLLKRKATSYIAVIYTDTGREDLSDFDIMAMDRQRCVRGYGAHILVRRDGSVLDLNDLEVYGNVDVEDTTVLDESIFVQVVSSPDTMTEEQVTTLERTLDSLEALYPDASIVYLD
ncbi:hypothetical protein [Vibrio sp. SCSIO 43137]|uniref:hypothetical protein n=1 Tax=Vibrio sp. SCSIO 43137 TaxID=3021011 RepID=UPI002307C7F2|nr:hypothetical protein [Vibrio sp. SCSIO 43137]WCE28441.1 hypothetical protein PK654_08635 [Vibrio sp. SCSIO 43137]